MAKAKAKAKRRGVAAAPATPSTGALPATRKMTVIAQDPDVPQADGNILMACIDVPAEVLGAGPVGYRVQVVDFDSSSGKYHGKHSLPSSDRKEPTSWRAGDRSIVGDHRFHAQNTYALVMKTLARFEFALGRRVGWGFGVHQLKVAPNGVLDANAFYSRTDEGLVFGHFPGRGGRHIYTCLSHDVVVHETTHALLDGLRERYLDPSGPDQAAFHEGFGDIVALLSVFSQVELVRELLRRKVTKSRPRGYLLNSDLTAPELKKSALFKLAEEMGKEIQVVRGEALRQSAMIPASPALLQSDEFAEPHRRGEILVAAVMNGFIEAWTERLGKGTTPGQKLQAITRVAEEGADIADALVTMWIRALDYMPPVHIEFSDVLTAALTADQEVRPDDSRFALRRHMRDSFAAYGIAPAPTSDADGMWQRVERGQLSYDRLRYESMRSDKDEVFRFLWENRDLLEVCDEAYTEVLTVLPCVRTGLDGFTLHETVAQYYQVARMTAAELKKRGIVLPPEYQKGLRREKQEADKRRAKRLGAVVDADGDGEPDAPEATGEPEETTTPVYGGGVLIFDEYGRLKYHIHNDVFGSKQSERLDYLWRIGQLQAGPRGAQMPAFRLSALHRQRAIDSRRFPEEGW